MFLTPIFGALTLATGTILEKTVLLKKAIGSKQFQILEFLSIVLVMVPFVFLFWNVSPQAFQLNNILIFLGVIILSVLANYFTFASMKKQKVSMIQPARMMEPFFTLILALIFSFIFEGVYEKNFQALIPALIAGLALIFSNIEKHHVKFEKYFVFAIIGSFFFASELVVSRLILNYYSSISFYFVRCVFVLILTYFLFRPKVFQGVENGSKLKILIAGVIWVIFRTILYSGYKTIGVFETTLMIMLGPVFIYLFAWKFLKEKPTWKNLIASGIIILCVLYSTLIQ